MKIAPKVVGSLADGHQVDKVKLDDDEIEIYGNKDDLKDIDEITGKLMSIM